MIKACRAGCLLSLLFAVAAVARAEVVVRIDAQRGTITAGTTSLGAFTATSDTYNFRALIWSGDASVTWRFSDAVLPDSLTEPLTIAYTNASAAVASLQFVLGGPDYIFREYSDDPFPTEIAPSFYTWNLVSGTTTITPKANSVVGIQTSNTGTVDGGGTFTATISGALDFSTSTASFSGLVQLVGVDTALYGYSDLLILTKAVGTFTVAPIPEPADYALSLAACAGVVVVWRRSRRPRARA